MATLPLPPHRSLLHGVEQLPAYTPRRGPPIDSETASVHSNAPSYVSAAPSYHSYVPPFHRRANDVPASTSSITDSQRQPSPVPQHQQQERQQRPQVQSGTNGTQRHGLPPTPMYARGFENRVGPTSPFSNSSNFTPRFINNTTSNIRSIYNPSEWVPVVNGLQSRHYRNVVNRRATTSSVEIDAISRFIFPGLFQTTIAENSAAANAGAEIQPTRSGNIAAPASLGPAPNSSTITLVHSPTEEQAPSTPAVNEASLPVHSGLYLPLSPHEDPDLVGEEAAARFRSQRLYMASQQNEIRPIPPSQSRHNGQQQDSVVQPGLVYQYSSLVSPASTSIEFTPSPEQQRRAQMAGHSASSETTLPQGTSTEHVEPARSRTPETRQSRVSTPTPAPAVATASRVEAIPTPNAQPGPVRNIATRVNRRPLVEREDVLRAQESQDWDFMLSQMGDGEERGRGWKRYKGQVEKQIHVAKHLKFAPLLIVGWRRKLEEKRKAKARALR